MAMPYSAALELQYCILLFPDMMSRSGTMRMSGIMLIPGAITGRPEALTAMARQATPPLLALETTMAMRAAEAAAAGAVDALTPPACMTASAAAMPRAQQSMAPALVEALALLERWSTRYNTFWLTLFLARINLSCDGSTSVCVIVIPVFIYTERVRKPARECLLGNEEFRGPSLCAQSPYARQDRF